MTGYKGAAENRLDAGHQFLGIKGLDDIVIRAQLQPKNLIEDFALGGKHDDGRLRVPADLTADLIAIHARKHQIQKNQIRVKFREGLQGVLSVLFTAGFKTLLVQIQRYELGDIGIIVRR